MNLASIIILAIVLAAVALALRSLRRGGGSCKCGGGSDCHCGAACSGCALKEDCHK